MKNFNTFTFFNQLTAMPKRLAMVLTMLLIVGIGQAWGAEATVYTSNVELSTTSGTKATASTAKISSVEYNAMKLGSSGNAGNFYVTIPANTTTLTLHAAAWNGKNSNTLTLSTETAGVTISPSTAQTLTANSGISGNSTTYTITPNDTKEFFTYTVTGATSGAKIKFACSERCLIWGVNAETSSAGGGNTGGDSGDDSGDSGDGEWTLVTDASTLKSGDQIVIASNTKGFVAGAITSDYMANSSAVTFSADKSSITSLPDDAEILTLGETSGAWTLTNEEDKQLGATAVKKVAWDSGTKTWSISISNNDATIQNGTSSYGRFLHNVNSTRFTTYTSNTSSSMLLPQIYKKNTVVTNLPQLATPTNLNASNITATSATLTWDWSDNENEAYLNGYNLYYKKVGDANFTGPLTCNTNSSERTGLTPNTQYVFKVAATSNKTGECKSSEQSAEFTFTTASPTQLSKPTGLKVTNISATSATLSWSAVANASSYLVTIVDGGDLSADVPNDQTSYTFTNLTPETEYLWTVKAIGDGTTYLDSEESETGEFTTTSATCTVTYDANGGEGTVTDTKSPYDNGETVTVVGNYGALTRNEYAFTGWNTKADGTGTDYKAGDQFAITSNTTLYAQWCEADWKLVTDASEIENDTRIVIAAKDYNVAMSKNQNNDKTNRKQTEITKIYNTISLEADVQTLALVKLVAEDKFYLFTGTGYLYAASSSSNYLKTGTSVDNNYKWTFAINEGVATINATGSSANNQLKYNYNGGSGLFSCYGTGNTQKDVVIYKEVCKQASYNVTSNLTYATAANTNATTVSTTATTLTLKYTANTGYLLPETITVKMGGATLVGGTDYTWDKASGQLNITVTGFFGDIDVKIVAEADPCYGFAMSTVTATSTTNSITLTWTEVSGATGYNVKLGAGDFTAATGTSHTFEGLSPKTEYTWEVQAVKETCEASKTGSTTTQKETFTVSWVVNGNTQSPYATESVVDGNKVTSLPETPSAPLGCSSKVFVGWTKQPILTPTNDAPANLFTKLADFTAITANTTFHAVFADEESGGTSGETTTVAIGDQVVIVQVDDNTTELTGFRSDKTITDANNYGTHTAYSTTPAGTLVWTVEEGASSGTFAFKNGNYYLNLGDNDNHLSCSTTKNTFSSWSVTESNNRAVVTNVQYDSRKIMWNQNSPRFACYNKNHGLNSNQYYYHIKFYKLNGGTTYSAYTTLCDDCTPSTLSISADKSTENLGANGKAVITFTHEDGNGGEITYTADPASGVSWNGAVATFSKAGTYTISASQAKNGNNCPTISNEVEITITAIPVLYFTTEPANPIVFDPVECGSHTRLEDKKTVSLQGYNLTSPVAVTVTGPYKIARTLESTLADYTTELSLDNNQDGTINNNYDDIHILSYPPVGLSNPTTGTLTFTTAGGNKRTVNLSTPEITCTKKTLTFNDRGNKTTQEYFAGEEVPEPEEPTDICTDPILYEFDGWSFTTVENGSTEYTEVEFPFNMPANNQTTLHSVFKYIEEEVTKYTTTLECTTCQKTNIHVDNHKTIVKETTLDLTTLVTSVNTSAFVFTCEDNYATLSGSIFTATQAGTYTINVTQEEDATYCATSATITIKVVATGETWGITWNVAGRTNTGLSPRTVYKGEPIGTLPTPTTPAGCEGKHFMGWTTTRSVNNDGIGITYIDHNTTPTENSTYYAVFAELLGSGAGEELFYESFDTNEGKGGKDNIWDGNGLATADIKFDNDGWTHEKGSGAYACIKLGTASATGSATTPALGIDGKATLNFEAAAWVNNKEAITINLEIVGDGTIEPASVTLTKGEFTNYTANITGGTVNTCVKFTAIQSTNNRFFLDEVRVYAKGDVPATYTDYTTSCGDYLVTYYGFTGGYSTTCDGNPGEIAVPQGSDYMIPNCTPTTDPQDLGRTFAGTWNTKANGSGTSYTPGATIEYVNDNITLYAQWTMATSGNTTLPTDESGIADLANTDVIVHGGNTLTLAEGTTTIKSLTLKGGIQEDKSYAMPIVKIPDNATLVRKDNKINLDLKINNQNFYPFAVPFEVANTAANINYINTTLKEYVNAHNGYGKFYVIREYNGALRAENGANKDENWVHVGRSNNEKLLPGKGYIISAVPASGTDTVTIRITMTVDNKWLANGEQTSITSGSNTTTRNQVAVTAYTGTAATNDPCNAGWNFVANPYLTHFAGASMKDNSDKDLDYIEGEIIVNNGHFEHDGTEIPYVTVPAADFGWYDQYRVSDVKLSPMWSFFVQIGTGGTMNFTTAGRQQAPAALRANAAAENPRIEANLAILYGEQKADHTGLIIDDRYTSDYEIGADLEKMFGSAYNTTIYTLSHSTRLAYNAVPHHVAQQSIPLGFRAAEDGEYTISLTNYEEITGVESIILHDLYTNEKTNLLHLDYTFYTEQTQDDNRFVVYLVPRNNTATDISTIIDEAQQSENRKVLINNHLYIIHEGKVYNGAGQIVK